MTINFKNETLLIIAPHADDEVLGCHALMKKIKNTGGKVYVQIITMGHYDKVNDKSFTTKKWKDEFKASCKAMQVDGHDIMLQEDNIKHVDDVSKSTVIEYIEKKSPVSLFTIKPTIVAIPTIFSSHQDHVATYQCAISALRIHASAKYVTPNMVISYESPEYNYWSENIEFGRFIPNLHLQMTSQQIDEKIDALYKYQTQITVGKRDASRIRALSITRGSEIGEEFAESYHVHRLIAK